MDLSGARLRNQYIDGSSLEDPAAVVRALCAVQAQDYYAALWAIGLRLRGASEADVEKAITDKRIVRTWAMRGTLHFVAAEDVRWLTGVTAPRTLKLNAARLQREFGVDARLLKRARKIVTAVLSGGRTLTRPALYAELDARGIETGKQRGLHILWWLAHEGLICGGARAGKQQTFALLDEWVPEAPAVSRDAALARLAQRYFAHHGPATLADFAWWTGLTLGEARLAIDGAQSSLSSKTSKETTWWSAASARSRAKRAAVCHLLPVYDEFTVGYADRSAVLEPVHAKRAELGNGIFRAPILLDGRIAGSWSRELKKTRVDIRLALLAKLNRGQLRSIVDAADRYGEFLRLPAKVIAS